MNRYAGNFTVPHCERTHSAYSYGRPFQDVAFAVLKVYAENRFLVLSSKFTERILCDFFDCGIPD